MKKTDKEYTPRDPNIVSFTMSHIRSKETGIEKKLRAALHKAGFRYLKNTNKVLGHPDIANVKEKIAIFADSEFWHGYHFEENEKKIQKNRDYWIQKIKRNIERDKEVNAALKKEGYAVFRYWGFEIEKETERITKEILEVHERRKKAVEQPKGKLAKTTLCYLEKDDSLLMLYRNKKGEDMNHGKWIGVGGHQEANETTIDCLKREFKEETGLTLTKYRYRGYIDFLNDLYEPERMYLYLGLKAEGKMNECDEGELSYVKKDKVLSLNLWDGDRAFLPLLCEEGQPFHMSLIYHGDELIDVIGPTFLKAKKKKKKKARRKL